MVAIKENYSQNTIQLKTRFYREKQNSEHFKTQYRILQNKFAEKKRLNLALVQKYSEMEEYYNFQKMQNQHGGSIELNNASTISSKSFF